MDDILLYSLKASARNPDDYVVIGEFLSDDPYAIMLRKDDAEFKKLVDSTVGQPLQERRNQQDLQQVVRIEDPAQGHQPRFPDVGSPESRHQEPERHRRRCLRQDEVLISIR